MKSDHHFTCENGAILVVSDLHLGDKAFGVCDGRLQQFFAQFEKRLAEPEVQHIVLNGDIIGTLLSDDFTHFDIYLDMIERWTKLAPQAEFHYVLGNHDMTEGLVSKLKERFKDSPAFHVADVWLRCGDVLFTHGDHGERNEQHKGYKENQRHLFTDQAAESIRKNYYSHEENRKPRIFANLEPFHEPTRKVCRVLDEQGLLDNINIVVTGHTHRPLHGLEFETRSGNKLNVFNTGSTIAGAMFAPIELHMNEYSCIDRREDKTPMVRTLKGHLPIIPNDATSKGFSKS